jgi:hypothetical protein
MPGVYPVGAIGVPPSGLKGKTDNDKDLVRDTIDLDVERSDSPKILTAELSNPYDRTVEGFHKVGETRWLSIIGVFADGTKVELRSSKLTSYTVRPNISGDSGRRGSRYCNRSRASKNHGEER